MAFLYRSNVHNVILTFSYSTIAIEIIGCLYISHFNFTGLDLVTLLQNKFCISNIEARAERYRNVHVPLSLRKRMAGLLAQLLSPAQYSIVSIEFYSCNKSYHTKLKQQLLLLYLNLIIFSAILCCFFSTWHNIPCLRGVGR